jgi:hypothetical protein
MVAWGTSSWSGSSVHISLHTLSLKLQHQVAPSAWWITIVYGPQGDHEKLLFLQDLHSIRSGHVGPWVFCGDFNLIYKAEDKNNTCLNHRRLMGVFHSFLEELELSELHLQDRLYTWSNEHVHPTLSHIDHAFACSLWLGLYPHHAL